MENLFRDITVDESLEIDAGAFAAVSAAASPISVICYGILVYGILVPKLFA